MGWHTRHASTHVGAGGAFTLRDAKPYGLESCSGTQFSIFYVFMLYVARCALKYCTTLNLLAQVPPRKCHFFVCSCVFHMLLHVVVILL